MSVEEKPHPPWQRESFYEFQAARWPHRVKADEKELRKLFAQAARSPMLAEALEWARQHDIEFFVDRRGKNMGGYYQYGAGVVAILPGLSKAPVATLVHEIRHAWQDYHGFIHYRLDRPYAEHAINSALTEADADAHGIVAQKQWEASTWRKRISRRLFAPRKPALDVEAILQKNFVGWFQSRANARYYGRIYSESYARHYGLLKATSLKLKAEYRARVKPPEKRLGLNIYNVQDVHRLGEGFCGGHNYLASLQPDILPKKILRPSLVETFWGAATARDRELTATLRKTELRKKTARPGLDM